MAHWLVPPADASDDDPKPEGIIWEEHVWGDSGIELQDAFVLMVSQGTNRSISLARHQVCVHLRIGGSWWFDEA
ncbi:hypothetical protein Moror_8277 [Moniliophthora roreri MCA 2997]|uniref:Uncharacterized protein n=1 Tax=Moniliophthora roreri (strain MCA 2997) TaxID=1381753 RepID=V2XKP0_MONRO|nr:hypothetical protein Moror_8277 [Moniliophthora roreri MCA 2997]